MCRIDDVVLRLREGTLWFCGLILVPYPLAASKSVSMSEDRWFREHGTLHIPDAGAQNDFPMLGVVGGCRTVVGSSPSPAGGTH